VTAVTHTHKHTRCPVRSDGSTFGCMQHKSRRMKNLLSTRELWTEQTAAIKPHPYEPNEKSFARL
jgi:hypothetical protein